jgi:hypothetical protein
MLIKPPDQIAARPRRLWSITHKRIVAAVRLAVGHPAHPLLPWTGVFLNRHGAGTASVVPAAQAHDPLEVKLIAGHGAGDERPRPVRGRGRLSTMRFITMVEVRRWMPGSVASFWSRRAAKLSRSHAATRSR